MTPMPLSPQKGQLSIYRKDVGGGKQRYRNKQRTECGPALSITVREKTYANQGFTRKAMQKKKTKNYQSGTLNAVRI